MAKLEDVRRQYAIQQSMLETSNKSEQTVRSKPKNTGQEMTETRPVLATLADVLDKFVNKNWLTVVASLYVVICVLWLVLKTVFLY